MGRVPSQKKKKKTINVTLGGMSKAYSPRLGHPTPLSLLSPFLLLSPLLDLGFSSLVLHSFRFLKVALGLFQARHSF